MPTPPVAPPPVVVPPPVAPPPVAPPTWVPPPPLVVAPAVAVEAGAAGTLGLAALAAPAMLLDVYINRPDEYPELDWWRQLDAEQTRYIGNRPEMDGWQR